MLFVRKFLAGALVCWVGLAAAPASADLLSHRAVYQLSLGKTGSLTGGDGLLTFEVKDVCDGWAMDLKAEITLVGEEGEAHHLGWSQVSWESKDGKRYRYFSRELSDGEETSRRRGEAQRDDVGKPAKVIADLPRQNEFTLPAGALFPIQHTLALVKADADGTPYVLAQLFDGSNIDAAVEVGAAIGPGNKSWHPPAKRFTDLKEERSFPVALAFYISSSAEGVPDTEQNMRLYSNGVVGSLTFGLGDLTVHAVLDDLKVLPSEGC